MDVSKEGALINALMTGYNPMIRPSNASNPAVVVALGLAMTEIAELVSKAQQIPERTKHKNIEIYMEMKSREL